MRTTHGATGARSAICGGLRAVVLDLVKIGRRLGVKLNVVANAEEILWVYVDLVAAATGGASGLLVEEADRGGLGGELLHEAAGELANRRLGDDDDLAGQRIVHAEDVVGGHVVEALVQRDGPLFELAAVIVDPVGVHVGLIAPATPLALGRVLGVETARGGGLLGDAGILGVEGGVERGGRRVGGICVRRC